MTEVGYTLLHIVLARLLIWYPGVSSSGVATACHVVQRGIEIDGLKYVWSVAVYLFKEIFAVFNKHFTLLLALSLWGNALRTWINRRRHHLEPLVVRDRMLTSLIWGAAMFGIYLIVILGAYPNANDLLAADLTDPGFLALLAILVVLYGLSLYVILFTQYVERNFNVPLRLRYRPSKILLVLFFLASLAWVVVPKF